MSKTSRRALTAVAQWIGHHLQSQRSLVRYLVRASAWVADQVLSQGRMRGNLLIFLWHINVSLPLFLLLPLSKN